MVIGHHLVWTAYAWWLPNDPRGSSSREIRVEPIAALGELHYGRKLVFPSLEELREFYRRARRVLAHPILGFDDGDVAVIASCFARTIATRRYTCHACAIMPEHVHLVIQRHDDRAETMIAVLQEESRKALITAKRRRGNHPVWGGPGWKVFQSTPADMRRSIHYADDNPRERGLPPQAYPFVRPYHG